MSNSADVPASKDLYPLLANWEFEGGQIVVRKIAGLDGTVKIQMRLDLGVLQMEIKGRPDGKRVSGLAQKFVLDRVGEHESLLEAHLDAAANYERRNGTDLGFELSDKECDALRDEAVMYYYRYLALFVLEEFEMVERDTARNLRVLDLCRQFAPEPFDRFVLERYRPYILMMNTRAKAHGAMTAKAYRAGIAHIDAGLKAIRDFVESVGEVDFDLDQINEIRILRELREQIQQQLSAAPDSDLHGRLQRAVDQEQYEEAARLRDEIAAGKH